MSNQNPQVKIIDGVSTRLTRQTRLELKQLHLLLIIAEYSSILHAADEIHISQPAATKPLQDLEADFKGFLSRLRELRTGWTHSA